jgi:flagellar biosynthetic protein FliQ
MDVTDDVFNSKLYLDRYNLETSEILFIGREAIWTVVYVAGPILLIALSVGLLIGVIQAATSIQEMTLSFIPKLMAMVAALLIFGDYQLAILQDLFVTIFEQIPEAFVR